MPSPLRLLSLRLDPCEEIGSARVSWASITRLGPPLASLEGFSRRPRLPDVLCIGAQKSGTTWLYSALQAHPGIWKSRIKEVHFFNHFHQANDESERLRQLAMLHYLHTAVDVHDVEVAIKWGLANHLDWKWYSSLFEGASEELKVMDFTPKYGLLDDNQVREIARKMPGLKIILMLRDPVSRSLSGALHSLRLKGCQAPSLSQVEAECSRAENEQRSDYRSTIERWRRFFPKDQIHLIFFEDILWSPEDVLQRVCQFLGLDGLSLQRQNLTEVQNSGDAVQDSLIYSELKQRLARKFLPQLEWLGEELQGHAGQWLQMARARVGASAAAASGAGSSGVNNYTNNLAQWDLIHDWREDGDEWRGQAFACGTTYEDWKGSMIARYFPNLGSGGTILEIGPGHGRWTTHLADIAERLVLVDISPNCLDYCRRSFSAKIPLKCYLSLGSELPKESEGQIDGIWSFDCFVHLAPENIREYLREMGRVLRPGARAVIHYSEGSFSKCGWGRVFGFGTSSRIKESDVGWRSPIGAHDMKRWISDAGLKFIRKEKSFGWIKRSGVPRFGDRVAVLQKA